MYPVLEKIIIAALKDKLGASTVVWIGYIAVFRWVIPLVTYKLFRTCAITLVTATIRHAMTIDRMRCKHHG